MNSSDFEFPVIAPLVARHAEDAAFYWAQLDRASFSPKFGFEKLEHFNRLQDAHMAGLKVAGPHGWPPALKALERWRKAGEAFVCALLSLQSADHTRLNSVLGVVRQRPDELLRGLVSALAWAGSQSDNVISLWSDSGADPVEQVAALRAAAVRGPAAVALLARPITTYFVSTASHVRAAACRAAGVTGDTEVVSTLVSALDDSDLAVRAEAAIALTTLGRHENALNVLEACVLMQADLHASATGWYRTQGARRLNRWTIKLGGSIPLGTASVPNLLSALPARSALTFTMAHGDLAHLPFIVGKMDDPEVDRYAGWVWQTLTGVDLAKAGWTIAEHDTSDEDSLQVVTRSKLDSDNGLPRPLSASVRAHMASNPYLVLHGKQVLCGRELDRPQALELLERAPQAVRFLAASMLNASQSMSRMNVRAPAEEQHDIIRALRYDLATKEPV